MTFKPGQSGNPGGRPKVRHDIREMIREFTPEIIEALRQSLKTSGDRVAAANTLLAYGYGRPIQSVNHRVIRSWSELTGEELDALIAQGRADDDGEPLLIEGEKDNPT